MSDDDEVLRKSPNPYAAIDQMTTVTTVSFRFRWIVKATCCKSTTDNIGYSCPLFVNLCFLAVSSSVISRVEKKESHCGNP